MPFGLREPNTLKQLSHSRVGTERRPGRVLLEPGTVLVAERNGPPQPLDRLVRRVCYCISRRQPISHILVGGRGPLNILGYLATSLFAAALGSQTDRKHWASAVEVRVTG